MYIARTQCKREREEARASASEGSVVAINTHDRDRERINAEMSVSDMSTRPCKKKERADFSGRMRVRVIKILRYACGY